MKHYDGLPAELLYFGHVSMPPAFHYKAAEEVTGFHTNTVVIKQMCLNADMRKTDLAAGFPRNTTHAF